MRPTNEKPSSQISRLPQFPAQIRLLLGKDLIQSIEGIWQDPFFMDAEIISMEDSLTEDQLNELLFGTSGYHEIVRKIEVLEINLETPEMQEFIRQTADELLKSGQRIPKAFFRFLSTINEIFSVWYQNSCYQFRNFILRRISDVIINRVLNGILEYTTKKFDDCGASPKALPVNLSGVLPRNLVGLNQQAHVGGGFPFFVNQHQQDGKLVRSNLAKCLKVALSQDVLIQDAIYSFFFVTRSMDVVRSYKSSIASVLAGHEVKESNSDLFQQIEDRYLFVPLNYYHRQLAGVHLEIIPIKNEDKTSVQLRSICYIKMSFGQKSSSDNLGMDIKDGGCSIKYSELDDAIFLSLDPSTCAINFSGTAHKFGGSEIKEAEKLQNILLTFVRDYFYSQEESLESLLVSNTDQAWAEGGPNITDLQEEVATTVSEFVEGIILEEVDPQVETPLKSRDTVLKQQYKQAWKSLKNTRADHLYHTFLKLTGLSNALNTGTSHKKLKRKGGEGTFVIPSGTAPLPIGTLRSVIQQSGFSPLEIVSAI